MTKVIIADDEIFSRFALRTLLVKNFPEIQIVAECQDGLDVVKKAKDFSPDLIIMDIKMPGQNGIDASQDILSFNQDIKIIILSAYDYFSYIQKALDVGVISYLLKPFNEDQIVEKINKCRETVNNPGKSIKKNNVPEKNVRDQIHFNILLFNNIETNFNKEKIKKILNLPSIETGFILCIRFDTKSKRKMGWFNQLFCDQKKILHDNTRRTDVTYIIEEKDMSQDGILNVLNQARQTLSFSAGLSRFAEESSIPISYYNAVYSMNKSLETKEPEVFREDLSSARIIMKSNEYQEHIIRNIEIANYSNARRILLNLIMDKDCSKIYIDDFINFIFHILQSRLNEKQRSELDSVMDLNQKVENLEVPDKEAAVLKVLEIVESGNSCLSLDADDNIRKAFIYIQEKQFQEISLEDVANYINLTPQYLSSRFKQEFNINFVDYITDKRIAFSKELLLETDLSVKNISAKIGYSDPNYFSKVFKKAVGISPGKFRNGLGRMEGE